LSIKHGDLFTKCRGRSKRHLGVDFPLLLYRMEVLQVPLAFTLGFQSNADIAGGSLEP
jgi:hypothetical protein